MGGGAITADDVELNFPDQESIIGWIYPGYGGYGNYNFQQPINASNGSLAYLPAEPGSPNPGYDLNWSDRASFPTGAWSNGSEYVVDGSNNTAPAYVPGASYATAISRSVDISFIIEEGSNLFTISWMFGPYDGNFSATNHGRGAALGAAQDPSLVNPWYGDSGAPEKPKLDFFIVRIPCINGQLLSNGTKFKFPADMTKWEWLRLVLTTDIGQSAVDVVPRCFSGTLADLTQFNWCTMTFGIGNPQAATPLLPPTIKFKAGDGLGICIFSNTLCYNFKPNWNTAPPPQQSPYLLISPATFSLKVTPS
jgi:hypothetical protein